MAPMFPRSVLDRGLECALFCCNARRKRLERERSVERNARRSRKKNHEKKREGEGVEKSLHSHPVTVLQEEIIRKR